MTDIPTKEPQEIIAGDTLQWTKSLSDYPASDGYTLKYRLINSAGKIDITATADGDDHSISVTAAITAAYTSGTYTWTSYVEKGAGASIERYTIAQGIIEIKPFLPGKSAGYDTRSFARKMLDVVRTLLEGRIPKDINQYEHNGMSVSRMTPKELIDLEAIYARRVQIENARNRRKRGINSDFNVGVRFPK